MESYVKFPVLVSLGTPDISQNDQIDRSPIFQARYLYRVLTECCQIFNIGKEHSYLGGKPPKFAINEILSLLFS